MKITAIVLAGGKGLRAGGDIPKQYIEVGGWPILSYALKAFEKSRVDEIILVAGDKDRAMAAACGISKLRAVTDGGEERYDSVLKGLRAACGADYVLIHDGARPYITPSGINKMIDAVTAYGAAVAAMPSRDTVKITDGDGFVVETTDRRRTWCIQTPQCFRYGEILGAYESLESFAGITDDAGVFEKTFADRRIKLVDLEEDNSKITTREDIEYMEWRMKSHGIES